MYAGKKDLEAMRIIRQCGFICRESDGKPWVSTGQHISIERFDRLLKMGLIVSRGDSLFGVQSQTYVPIEEKHVQTSP